MRGHRLIFALSLVAAPLTPTSSAGGRVDPVLRQYIDHPGFTWKYKRTAHFNLYFQDDSDARLNITQLRRNVEADRDHVIHLLGATGYDPDISAFFVKSDAQMKDLIGAEVDGRSRPLQHAVFSVATRGRMHLTHELCHEIATNLWGAAEPWIEEGLAVYADEPDTPGTIRYDAWTLLSAGSLIPLEKLVRSDWNSAMYSPDVTYTELGGFVKFLHDRFGVERLRQIWQGGAAKLPEVTGESLADLEREWREDLVTQFPAPPTRHYRAGDVGFQLR
ncbi:MAG TPA: hypothetical protein VMU19_09015 [Bryobacteraceae bacterium]|nr:hypothetical protein [Bryobacteraceae bacterium]